MLSTELLWRYVVFASECLDEVAAIGEACFLSNIIQIKIRKKKQVLCFTKPDKFDILLTGLSIEFTEALSEVRVAHMTSFCELFYLERFVCMCINVFRNGMDGAFLTRESKGFIRIEAVRTPDAKYISQKRTDIGLQQNTAAVFLFPHFLKTVCKERVYRIRMQDILCQKEGCVWVSLRQPEKRSKINSGEYRAQ